MAFSNSTELRIGIASKEFVNEDLAMSIIKNAASALNLSINVTEDLNVYGGTRTSNGSWTGIIGLLQRSEFDIVTCYMGISHSRFEVVNFLATVIFSERKYAVGQSPKYEYSFSQFSQSVNQILYSILASFLLLVVVGSISTYLIPTGTVRTIGDNALVMVTVLLGKGLAVLPKMASRRILLSIWMLSTTFVIAPVFGGLMISMLSVETKSTTFFNSIEDIKKYPNVEPLIEKRSIDVHIFKLSKIPSFVELWKRCEKTHHCLVPDETLKNPDLLDPVENRESIFFGNSNDRFRERLNANKSCRFKLSEPFHISFGSFGVRKKLHWKTVDILNIEMLHAYEGHLFEDFKPSEKPTEKCVQEEDPDQEMTSFSLDKLSLIFRIWLFGLGISVLALLFEFVHFKYSLFKLELI